MDVKQGNRIDVAIMTSNKYRFVLAQEASTTITKKKENGRITSIKNWDGETRQGEQKKIIHFDLNVQSDAFAPLSSLPISSTSTWNEYKLLFKSVILDFQIQL